MRVLVSGGLGYLGAQVALRFEQRGDTIRVFDRSVHEDQLEWARTHDVVLGDLTDPGSLVGACEGIDVVVHAAALNQPSCAADPPLALQLNALGTRNLLAAAATAGVELFVYLSTIHVYGPLAGERVDEFRPPRPTTDYGVSKLAGEGYCHLLAATSGMRTVCLRPANGFGPPVFASADCWMLAVNHFCHTAYRTGTIVLESAGTQRRDFLALSDTVTAIETVVDASHLGTRDSAAVFNVGAGLSLTIRELARTVAEVCAEAYGRPIAVTVPGGSESVPDDAMVDFRYDALAALGYTPATDLRAGIRAVADYVAANDL